MAKEQELRFPSKQLSWRISELQTRSPGVYRSDKIPINDGVRDDAHDDDHGGDGVRDDAHDDDHGGDGGHDGDDVRDGGDAHDGDDVHDDDGGRDGDHGGDDAHDDDHGGDDDDPLHHQMVGILRKCITVRCKQ
ncbi:hypothetical protein AVEN_190282-1 [Araneus ventricosus]|uniref:Uncharacterized protein n=1 Tax=Araneus ventricosus TaxID=182803 RepID=A0A4Y2IUW2_ARAVE|nr:hypothetical protein AVEN_190282-1 [Araneus ventricosus]